MARLRAAVETLKKEIMDIQDNLQVPGSSDQDGLLEGKRKELDALLQERVEGAMVRARFINIRDMDAPSNFFFNLEKSLPPEADGLPLSP
ncbi:hypothetical protein LDENG_00088050 [Lucifuga dentata]|nr:hypothetical protein LDENG_00088050 [Lucifuga dentata]